MRDSPSDTYPWAMAEKAQPMGGAEGEIRRVVAEVLACEGRLEPGAWWRAGIAEALGLETQVVTPLRKSRGTDRP
jgi:hypothetical protein